jgi:hypothetical protein
MLALLLKKCQWNFLLELIPMGVTLLTLTPMGVTSMMLNPLDVILLELNLMGVIPFSYLHGCPRQVFSSKF